MMSSDASKSHDFQLVAFCEQMGAQFGTSVGVPLQPPCSYPPSANQAKFFGRELEVTVNFTFFTTHGSGGVCSTQGSMSPFAPRFVPPEDPQVAKPGKLFSLDVSSIGDHI